LKERLIEVPVLVDLVKLTPGLRERPLDPKACLKEERALEGRLDVWFAEEFVFI